VTCEAGENLNQESSVRKTTAAALLFFAILSLVLTYPLALHLGDAVEDRQDALLNVWITAWDGHQLLTDPLHLFDANIFYPYPRTLAYSELLLGNALLSLPVTTVTGNPVLGYNVALLLSFILSGFGTYLLVRKLTRSSGAGLVAGTIFAFSSYRMTNLAQAQLLTTHWIPFTLLAFYQLIRKPRRRYVAAFVLFFSLQALSSFYYGILLALAAVGFVIWEFGMRWNDIRKLSVVLHLLLAACLLLLVFLPFALPYFEVQRELGFERALFGQPAAVPHGAAGQRGPRSVVAQRRYAHGRRLSGRCPFPRPRRPGAGRMGIGPGQRPHPMVLPPLAASFFPPVPRPSTLSRSRRTRWFERDPALRLAIRRGARLQGIARASAV
jgi:hypothetical protein